jgi:hypothetical protein
MPSEQEMTTFRTLADGTIDLYKNLGEEVKGGQITTKEQFDKKLRDGQMQVMMKVRGSAQPRQGGPGGPPHGQGHEAPTAPTGTGR